jgi:UDP-GlcNAc:undecaprenyl-phosphate GlcNAc-1-phosphate transferase
MLEFPAFLVILAAFVVTLVSMPWVIKLAFKLGAIDQPDERKVHQDAMPRLGGMAIYISFLLAMLFYVGVKGPFTGLIIGASIVFIVGMLDDMYGLSAWVKLLGQCAAAGVAMYFGVMVEFLTNPFDGMLFLGYFSLPLTLVWIVGVSNAINLIDGLDGLAGGVSAIAAVTMGIVALVEGQALVAVTAFILAAGIAGFLPYNFYPARTFMGDGGSNFLGFVLACIAIMGTAKSAALISLFIPIVILGIPIFDTFFAILRRIHKQTPIFKPDKDHLHHRLMVLGMSHRRSVFTIYLISGFFSAVAITLTFITDPKAMLGLGLLLLIIVMGADKVGLLTGENQEAEKAVLPKGKPSKAEL